MFDDEQIAAFLELHLGKADAERARKFIEKTYDLKTLAPRPVLLEMIVKSLPTLWRDDAKTITPAGLYEHYTRLWLEDRSGRNLETPPVLRHRLLQVLAASLWRKTDRQMHHRELLEEVERMAPLFPGLDYTRVDVELRTAAFLVRSAEGYYRFSHKSFLEYFLAGHLWADLGVGAEAAAKALDLPPLTLEVGKFFWELTAEGREERVAALRGVLQAPYRVGVSENALRLGAWSWEVTEVAFRVEGAMLPGAQLRSEVLGFLELPEADLTGADFRGTVFGKAVFHGARMAGVRLAEAQLEGAAFQGADLTGADFTLAELSGSDFQGARLEGALFLDAELDEANFTEADLRNADLTGASGGLVSLKRAELRGVGLAETVFVALEVDQASILKAVTSGWLRRPDTPIEPTCLVGLPPRHPSWAWLQALAFSPDGRWVASAANSGEILIRDPRSGVVRRKLSGHSGRVWALAWSGEGGRLASAGSDGRIRIWDLEAGRLVAELSALDSGLGLVSIPGGFYSTWNPDGTPGRALGPREAQIEIPLPNGARYLPLGPLAEELHQPEKVRAALAAEL
ncbi:MAG: pentapeptide repeat-containing protein [Thermoanaerobaculia bacterium]|nr:pentapeptide repeat-containing protein [Thermoanaerobaculia bacterium]